jgi:hypothetical protein
MLYKREIETLNTKILGEVLRIKDKEYSFFSTFSEPTFYTLYPQDPITNTLLAENFSLAEDEIEIYNTFMEEMRLKYVI